VKNLFNALVLMLAINFLVVAGGAGWLYQSGHLDNARALAIRDVLFPPPAQPATQPTAATTQPALSPTARLEELLARHSGVKTNEEQVEFLQHSFDAQMGEIDQRQRQLEDLQRLVASAQEKLKADRANLDADRQKLTADQEASARLASDQGFQDSLNLYNAMPAAQVKTVFLSLDDKTVIEYLRAMTPRVAAKVIKEFKTPDETTRIRRILDEMREAVPDTQPAN
jgi:hypothetical protein